MTKIKTTKAKVDWKDLIQKQTEHRCDYDVLLKNEWHHKVVPRDDVKHLMEQKQMAIAGSDYELLQSFMESYKQISINALGSLALHLVLDAYGYGDVTIVAVLNKDSSQDPLRVLPQIIDHSADSVLTCIEALGKMESLLYKKDMYVHGPKLLDQGLFDAAFITTCEGNELICHLSSVPLISAVVNSPEIDMLTWKLWYAADLFEDRVIMGILDVIHEVVIQLVHPGNHSVVLKHLPLISEAQKAQLQEWNKTDGDFPTELCLHQLVEIAAQRTPGDEAMIFRDVTMTYSEVNKTANLLAQWLKTRGVCNGNLIALYMDKSEKVVLTMLAVWKAGAAFLPIDPSYPTDRVQFMLNDSNSRWVIASQQYANKLGDTFNGFKADMQIIEIENALEFAMSLQSKEGTLPAKLCSSTLAYVTYTSGTTGVPKGVPKYHSNVVNSITDLSERYNMLQPGSERVALFAAYVFEPFIRQMLIALINSQTLVVLPDEVRKDPEKFPDFLRTQYITYLNATGSILHHFDMSNLPDLKRLLLVGEELTSAGLQQIRKWFNGQIINEYAFTESAFVTAIKEFAPGENDRTDRSIGRPLRNVKCYVLSKNLKQLPPRAIGELYIGGIGVAIGYLNRPDLTKDCFLENPFQTDKEKELGRNQQIYKTGDLARVLPNGEFEYMGRSDFQLKLNGVRVEPGEIEAVAMKFPGVKKCVVIPQKRNCSTDQYLVGYFTVQPGLKKVVTEAVLIAYLNEHLISAMVPARMMYLDSIQTNINGKVDRNSLPKVSELLSAPAVRNATFSHYKDMYSLKKIWSEVLGISPENVSTNDDFFRSGGQSISCILLIAKIRQVLHKNVDIDDVFTLKTLGKIATHLANQETQQDQPDSSSEDKSESKPVNEISMLANGLHRGFLYQSLKAKESDDAYIMQSVYSYKCEIHPQILKQAWELVTHKYPGLRLRFEWRDQPLQIIEKRFSLCWSFQDLNQLKSEEQNQRIKDLQKQDRKTPYKMEEGPLFRVYLIRKQSDEFVLVFSCHHIILDGWSLSVLHDDVHNIYLALMNNRKVEVKADEAYISAQKYWKEHHKDNIDYWQLQISQIGDRCDLTGLLKAEVKYKTDLFNYDQVREHKEKRLILNGKDTSKAKLLCSDNSFTLHSALQFAWHKVLNVFGGGTFTVLGTVVSGRNIPIAGIERSIGLFINTLPVIVNHEVQKNETIADAITKIQATVNAANSHHIIDLGCLDNGTRKHSLFDTLFVLENYPKLLMGENGLKQPNEALCFDHEFDIDKVDYPLAVVARIVQSKLVVSLWYAGELFDDKMIDILLETMSTVLSQVISDPLKPVSELQFCSLTMLAEFDKWNQTEMAFNNEATLHGVFKEVSTKWPDSTAVVFENTQLTYSELDKKANQMAHFLKKKVPKLQPNHLVAMILNKNEKMIIAILAVWKAGAAYVPIDSSFPDDRIKFMLEDTQSCLVLTNSCHEQQISQLVGDSQLVLDIDTLSFDTEPYSDPLVAVKSTDLAYAIYTSGTTGKPKAVLVEHRGVVNLQASLAKIFCLKRQYGQQAFLSFSNYVFDHFVEQMTDALLNGQKLVILNDDMRGDQAQLVEYIRTNQVTYLSGTPSVLSLYDFSNAPSLTHIDAIGEDFTRPVFDKIRTSFEGLIINGYGPTEVSITTHKRLYSANESRVDKSIGYPVANIKVYVLNESMVQIPIGGIGELYLGGVGVARGYLNNEKLTAERFVANPFQTDAERSSGTNRRLYRTGDLVRWLPSGEIEYLGRTDQQVKIRGHRIELGEIESVLTSFPGISRSIIVAREHKPRNSNVDNVAPQKYLVGFYIADHEINEHAIQEWMRVKLSSALVPARILRIKDIPVTANGKLDLKHLPETSFLGSTGVEFFAPENDVEVKLCEIWSKILNISTSRISVLDDFFNLGGDSIGAISLVQSVKHRFTSNFAISAVFENVTIRSQAKHIESLTENKEMDEDNTNIKVPPVEQMKLHSVSMGQQRILFIDEFEGGTSAYNIHMCLQTSLEKDSVEHHIRTLLHRHRSLRSMMVKTTDGEWIQKILSSDKAQSLFQLVQVTVYSEDELDDTLNREAEHVFRLAEELPVYFTFLEVTKEGLGRSVKNDNLKYLSLVFHHSCFDGWSWNIFCKELGILVASPNGHWNLETLTTTYTDFVSWQKQLLSSSGKIAELKKFWKTYLAGAEPATLPQDCPRPAKFDYQGREFVFEIDEEMTENLRALARTCQVSLYSLLLAGFSLMIETFTMQKDFILGTPFANRENPEFQNVIGFFATLMALRVKVDPAMTIHKFIRSVSKAVTDAQGHSEIPFEELIHCMDVPVDPSRNPLVQIVFTLLKENNNGSNENQRIHKQKFEEYKPNSNGWTKTKFDVTVMLTETKRKISGIFTYASSIYDDKSAVQFSKSFLHILVEFIRLAPNKNAKLLNVSRLSQKESKELQKTKNLTNSTQFAEPIHLVFEKIAAHQPHSVAVLFENQKITYSELDKKANDLRNAICQAVSLCQNDLVALVLDKSDKTIEAILAVWKSGAAYVPIDPSYPDDRIGFMLADTDAKLIITSSQHAKRIQKLAQQSQLILEMDTIQFKTEESLTGLVNKVSSNDLAYAIYTSGTTGKPKAVLVKHHNFHSFLTAARSSVLQTNKQETVLLLSNYVFDFSLEQIALSILSGNCLLIPDAGLTPFDEDFYNMLNQGGLTYLSGTPTQIHQINLSCIPTLQTVLVAGESFQKHHFEKIKKSFTGQLFSAYGTTETTVYNTVECFSGSRRYKNCIGSPLTNSKLYVLNEQFLELPHGAVGELYLSGECVSKGYHNQPDLTSQKFLPAQQFQFLGERNQYSTLYRTGDLVRKKSGGTIEYTGRNDSQLKINGLRIEPSEIEAVLSTLPGVKQCSIVTSKDSPTNAHNLVGYILMDSDHAFNEQKMLAFLKQKLPPSMVPSHLVEIEKCFPMTVNGKLDMHALTAVPLTHGHEIYTAPRNRLDAALCKLWQETTGNSDIGIDDDFFHSGGDSIKAMMLASLIKRELKQNISVKHVFDFPTVHQFSDNVVSNQRNQELNYIKNETNITRPTGMFPLLPIQKWFFSLSLLNKNFWNQTFALKTPTLNPGKLKKAVEKLADYHDAFHLHFCQRKIDKEFEQFYSSQPEKCWFHTMDVTGKTEQEIQSQLDEWQDVFNIEKGPLWCTAYLHGYSDGSAKIWFAVHHLIIDSVSWQILGRDLEILYNGGVLEEKVFSYIQWATLLQNYKPATGEHELWRNIKKELSKASNHLSTDCSNETHYEYFKLSIEETKSLLTTCQKAFHTHINDLLLTALGFALKKITHCAVNHVTLESHGRPVLKDGPEIRDTVGWFTAMYPFPLEVQDNLAETILQMKSMRNQIPNQGIGYGLLCGTYGTKHAPLPEISFNYLGVLSEEKSCFKQASSWCLDSSMCGIRKKEGNASNSPFAVNITMFCDKGQLNTEIDSRWSNPEKTHILSAELKNSLKNVISNTTHIKWGSKNCLSRRSEVMDETSAISVKKPLENFEPYIIIETNNIQAEKTLFLFPPGEGGAESYLGNIAKQFCDSCLVIFNNIHLSSPMGSFESLGKYYLDHMMKLQPSGSFNLLGWSFGGVLAVEVAIQLINTGHKVSNLFIIDSYFDVCHASKEIGITGKDDILDPINYYYQPSSEKLQQLAETCASIVLFKAGKMNDIASNEEQKLIFAYYHKSAFNCLDKLVPEKSINLQILANDTHHSWVHNQDQVASMSKFIGHCIKNCGIKQESLHQQGENHAVSYSKMIMGHSMAALFGIKYPHKQVNSGSNGSTPLSVIHWAQKKQLDINGDPNKFFREQLKPEWRKNAAKLAEYVGCNQEDLALTTNCTFANILSIEKALEFRAQIGEDKILDYIHSLALSAGRMLAEMWKTDVLELDLSNTAFTNVRVPLKDASQLGFKLMERGFGFIPTVCIKNQWYARFSAQIFNTLEDYEVIGMEVLKIASESRKD